MASVDEYLDASTGPAPRLLEGPEHRLSFEPTFRAFSGRVSRLSADSGPVWSAPHDPGLDLTLVMSSDEDYSEEEYEDDDWD